jgi:PAS domain S-box-containing protein
MVLEIFPPPIIKNIKIGANILEITPLVKESDRYEKYLDVMKTGKSLFLEDIIINKDFSDQSLNIKTFKVNDGLGMIITDTTKSKQAQLKLKDSEEKYRQLIEQSKDGVALVQGRKIVFTNSIIYDMLGYTQEEFSKLEFADIAHPDELSRLHDFHIRRMNNEEFQSIYETKLIAKDGTVMDVEFNVAKTTYVNEGAVLIMARDISERKITENKIIKYQERLKALASELIITEERQRKQIATDLHDNVGQLLASSRLQMAAINEGMEKEVILLKIESVSQGMLQAIQSIRNAIFDLSPPQLNEIGLFAATSDWLEDQIELKHGIKTTIRGEDRFYPLTEIFNF